MIVSQKRSTDKSWLPPGLAVRMWRADGSGRQHISKGDPDSVLYKPLWGEVEVNHAKHNAEKEMLEG